MQQSLSHSSLSLPPMHIWPRPIKVAVLGLGAAVCLGVYAALLTGILSLVMLLLASAW